MPIALDSKDADVTVEDLDDGRKRIFVQPRGDFFVSRRSCETDYSPELIRLIFSIKGAGYLCDEICRDIDPEYVRRDLEHDLTAYFVKEDFANKRILDFGCGSGASSMILARMFPTARIVGVELEEKLLDIARARVAFYQGTKGELYRSRSGNELPANIGEFDFVILSAVYEHLLPRERETVMPLIWSAIKPDGFLFLNMTPHRYFPIEHHTTGVPLLNYLPPSLALSVGRRFSKRIDKTEPWETMLRRGIRGSTEHEILRILSKADKHHAVLLEPTQNGLRDRIDLWYSALNQQKAVLVNKSIKALMKSLRLATGIVLVPNLSLVIKKQASAS